jgi:hypothetical protein
MSSVEAYCSYGAVSRDQLAGCIEHVTEDDFADRPTNAARFARGELETCRSDAGPFCGDDSAVARAHKMIEERDESGAPGY